VKPADGYFGGAMKDEAGSRPLKLLRRAPDQDFRTPGQLDGE
jgi:hypothetical protein